MAVKSKKNPGLVSVCMPVYNGASFLHSSVRSVLDQTYDNLEMIVVDDGSTDSTLKILQSFKDPRLKIIKNKENAGNLTRRNQAFEAAQGDFIAIMDADDFCRPDRLERQVATLKNGYELCGSFAASGESPARIQRVWRLPQSGPALVRSTLFGSPMANPSAMMTRKLLDKAPFRFNLDYFPAADYEAWARSIFIDRVPTFIVPAPLIFRRIHGASITHTKAKAMANQADKVREKLFATIDTPEHLVALHNKALVTKLSDKEFAELRELYDDFLPRALPDLFSAGVVYYRQNDVRIPLKPVVAKTAKAAKKVSVIVPAYNVGQYLSECVLSVVESNSDGVEVIIVDDGSTDDTPKIAEALRQKFPEKLRIVTQKNGGLSAARNAGVAASEAEYVFFLDGDDFMASGALDLLYAEARKGNADVALPTHSAYYEDTKLTEPRHEVKETMVYNNHVFDSFARRKFGYTAMNKLVRRELAEETPFFKGILHEDELFCPELFLKAKRVTTVAKELYYYRQRAGSITSSVSEKHVEDWLLITEKVFELGLQHGFDTGTSDGFSLLMNYLCNAARRKLPKIENCSEAFEEKVHGKISLLEARLTRLFGVRDAVAGEASGKPTGRNTDAQWKELRRLQDLIAKQTAAMDRQNQATLK